MKKVIHKVKKWLNTSTTSFIYAYLENDDGYRWGQFKLGDCNKIVSFDIELDSPKKRKATMKKLMIISDEAYNMCKAIEEME